MVDTDETLSSYSVWGAVVTEVEFTNVSSFQTIKDAMS